MEKSLLLVKDTPLVLSLHDMNGMLFTNVVLQKSQTNHPLNTIITRKHSNRMRTDCGSGLHSGGRGRVYPTSPSPRRNMGQQIPYPRKGMGPQIPYPPPPPREQRDALWSVKIDV